MHQLFRISYLKLKSTKTIEKELRKQKEMYRSLNIYRSRKYYILIKIIEMPCDLKISSKNNKNNFWMMLIKKVLVIKNRKLQ